MASVPCIDDIPASLTEDEFWQLFGRLEHERLDFKRGVPTDVRDAIPAMAMTDGGLIVCGVADEAGWRAANEHNCSRKFASEAP